MVLGAIPRDKRARPCYPNSPFSEIFMPLKHNDDKHTSFDNFHIFQPIPWYCRAEISASTMPFDRANHSSVSVTFAGNFRNLLMSMRLC
jgi:hypothetical protein